MQRYTPAAFCTALRERAAKPEYDESAVEKNNRLLIQTANREITANLLSWAAAVELNKSKKRDAEMAIRLELDSCREEYRKLGLTTANWDSGWAQLMYPRRTPPATFGRLKAAQIALDLLGV